MTMTATTTRFSTVKEVAAIMRISKMTVYRLVETGELPSYKFGGCLRIPTAGVWQYIKGQYVDHQSLDRAPALERENTGISHLRIVE